MLAKHYAPRTPMECLAGSLPSAVRELLRQGERALGGLSEVSWTEERLLCRCRRPRTPTRPVLYAELQPPRRVGLSRIVVEMPPDTGRMARGPRSTGAGDEQMITNQLRTFRPAVARRQRLPDRCMCPTPLLPRCRHNLSIYFGLVRA